MTLLLDELSSRASRSGGTYVKKVGVTLQGPPGPGVRDGILAPAGDGDLAPAFLAPTLNLAPAASSDRFDLLSIGVIRAALGSRIFRFIVQAHGTSQERLRIFLKEVSADDLARPLPDGTDAVLGNTLGEALTAFAWHEGYHLGQLGILRRVAGLDGAIA